MLTVKVTSVFPASDREIFEKLQKLETLQYIAYPFATFNSVDGKSTLVWRAGEDAAFDFKLFGIIPFGIHRIRVIRFDLSNGILTHESNPHVPVWNHAIILDRIDHDHARYSDVVDIEAGWKTIFVYLWAVCFYHHRQRKWQKLLKNDVIV